MQYFDPKFCPPFEGPPFEKEGPPSSQGRATLLTRKGHPPHKEKPTSSQGGATPPKKEEICHLPEPRS